MSTRNAACGCSGLPSVKVQTSAVVVMAQFVVVSRRVRYVVRRPTSARYRWISALIWFEERGSSPCCGAKLLAAGAAERAIAPRDLLISPREHDACRATRVLRASADERYSARRPGGRG